jgi:hypothetical protein
LHEQPTPNNNNNNHNNHFKSLPVANEFYNNSTEKELTDTTLFQSAYQNQGIANASLMMMMMMMMMMIY